MPQDWFEWTSDGGEKLFVAKRGGNTRRSARGSVALILGLIFRWVLYTTDVHLAYNL